VLLRTAGHLYWMGRYLERAENTAQAVEGAARATSLPTRYAVEAWDGLLAMAGIKEEFFKRYHAPSTADMLHFILFDPENPVSLLSSLRAARENGRTACAALSSDAWESLNALWLDLNELDQYHLLSGGITPCLVRVKEGARLVRGALEETLVREEALRLITLGSMLERADHLVRVLRVRTPFLLSVAERGEAIYYASAAVLQTAGAAESYRKVYHDVITPWRVIELLVLRPENPCSLRACLDRIADGLDAADRGGGEAARLAGGLCRQLHDERMALMLRQALPEQLADFADGLGRLNDGVAAGLKVPLCA
jgi:uncharacterized alpha-E superfamily protein